MKLKEMFIAFLAGLFLVILLGIVFGEKETSKNQIWETTKTTTKTTISFETSVATDPVFQITSDTTYSVEKVPKNQSYTKKPIISKKINFPKTKPKFNSSSWKTKSPPSSAFSPFGRDVYVSPQGEKKIIENPPNLSVTEKTLSSDNDVGGILTKPQ